MNGKIPFQIILTAACFLALGGAGQAQTEPGQSALSQSETSRLASQERWPSAPPQNQGLPYTLSGRQRGMTAIKDYIAVCAGSRYAYANGFKIRLDDAQLLGGEALLRGGKVYVPATFAGVLSLPQIAPDQAPDFLKDRWVHTLKRNSSALPAGVEAINHDGKAYVDVAALAGTLGLKVYQSPLGFVLISRANAAFDERNTLLAENIVTLFDTPEKLVDPDLATQYIPRLKLQGKWTDHVDATPAQLALLDGPETQWEEVPKSAYDLSGFNSKLLGSAVPAPGVYPRLLFSPEDVPGIYERMKGTKVGQTTLIKWEALFKKSWWDPKSSDGQVFEKLVAGRLEELRFVAPRTGTVDPENYLFQGQTPVLFNAYVNYNMNSLVSMALYCLLTGNETRGRETATAIVNYYRKVEPLLDTVYSMSDSQFGTNNLIGKFSDTGWRGMRHVVAHMDLGLALDFAGKWMTPEQRAFMQRIVAKATYGRLDNMQAAPVRLRDGRTTTWHLTNFIAASAIEGLEGCDPEVIASGQETTRAFLDWGIDKHGTIFEGNGVNILGLQYEVLSMIIMARRGDNLWGHPHWRKLLAAQVQSMSPDGWAVMSSGHLGGGPFSYQIANEFKAFYPDELAADWLLNHQIYVVDQAYEVNPMAFDQAGFEKALGRPKNRMQAPGPTNPGNAFTAIYDTDWKPVTREEIGLPLTFNDDVYGLLSAYSSNAPDATWLALHARANQYLGSGLFDADVGMFYFSAQGVNWITEAPFTKEGSGRYHNLVLVTNRAEPDGIPARGDYLGAALSPQGAFATVDQTKSYSYEWSNLFELWDELAPSSGQATTRWELETDPQVIAAYKGTERYKSRSWAPAYVYTNWIPVVRRPWNPMQHVFRSAGLVRGAHPYALVVDDVKKDDQTRLYQWTAVLGGNITQAKLPDQEANEVYLVRNLDLEGTTPKPGSPMLMVHALPLATRTVARTDAMKDGPVNRYNERDRYNRITVETRANEARYRVLLIPFKMGEARPKISYDPDANEAVAEWPDQKDTLKFVTEADSRTRFTITRGGENIARVQ